MQNKRDYVASLFDETAHELQQAAEHYLEAARHFREGEVPRGCAHEMAARGYINRAELKSREAADIHAAASRIRSRD